MDNLVNQFLDKYRLTETFIDLKKESSLFLAEMQKALKNNKKSSLGMLKTHLALDFELELNKKVAVIDAGGTNLRTCLVSFDSNKQPVIESFEVTKMPGIDKEVSSKEFFATIANQLRPLLNESDAIGFSFSYEAESLKNKDAIAIAFSKEIKASQVIGKKLGSSLLKSLKAKDKKIVVINDTVATLLAGKLVGLNKNYSSFVGYILGTGTNSAYWEDSKNQIINTEAGAYDYVVGPLDEAFIQTTAIASYHRFEKMVGGAYIGSFSLLVIKQAVKDSIFKNSTFENVDELSTKELSDFLENPQDEENILVQSINSVEDEKTLLTILDAIIKRVAKLTALGISAAVLKSNRGKDSLFPVCINIDGSTFYKTKNLKKYTTQFLNEFLKDEMQTYFELVHVENSPIIGSAIAALSL
jgi:hexokinase